MNSLHASPACRLAFGMSRITVRRAHVAPTPTPTATATLTATSAAVTAPPGAQGEQMTDKNQQQRKRKKEAKADAHPPAHGERIWIHNHIYDGHVMYSFTRAVDSNKGFRQMPYTGKKLVPAKMRRDYWRPMALIEFGPGLGGIGRSVFQKLREFKKRHELEWGREDAAEEERLLRMSKPERGRAINDQRANAVADVAAVLAGAGKGNKMWMVDWGELAGKRVVVRREGVPAKGWQLVEKPKGYVKVLMRKLGVAVQTWEGGKYLDWQRIKDLSIEARALPEKPAAAGEAEATEGAEGLQDATEAKSQEDAAAAAAAEAESEAGELIDVESLKKLHTATIYWAGERDRFRASKWSDNVGHVLGLPLPKRHEHWHYHRDEQQVPAGSAPPRATNTVPA